MTNFFIKYNPYIPSCQFKKNGKVLQNNSKLGQQSKKCLQNILKKGKNWDGLLEEIAKYCNDKNITILFKGRKIDYDDLVHISEKYKGNTKFTLKFQEANYEVVEGIVIGGIWGAHIYKK